MTVRKVLRWSYLGTESSTGSEEGISRTEEIKAMKPQIRLHLQALLDDRLRSSGIDPVRFALSIL